MSFTYDGCLIVSDKFRAAVKHVPGGSFIALPAQLGWSLLIATREIAFDSDRRKTTFADFCETCQRFTAVGGATPALLLDPPARLPDEIMRTDVEFGTGDELRPLVLSGLGVAEMLRRERLTGLDLLPIEN